MGSIPVISGDIRDGRRVNKGFFLRVMIIRPLLNTHVSPPHEVCYGPNQAAPYHTPGFKLGASYLTQHLISVKLKVIGRL